MVECIWYSEIYSAMENEHVEEAVPTGTDGAKLRISLTLGERKFSFEMLNPERLNGLQFMGLLTSATIYIGTRADMLNQFLESYGAPATGSYIGYYFMRAVLGTSPRVSAAAAIALNTAFEIDQFIHPVVDVGTRTPDPRDVVASVVGAGIAYGFTKLKGRVKTTHGI